MVTEVTRNVTEVTNYTFAFYFKLHPLNNKNDQFFSKTINLS